VSGGLDGEGVGWSKLNRFKVSESHPTRHDENELTPSFSSARRVTRRRTSIQIHSLIQLEFHSGFTFLTQLILPFLLGSCII
jgi:hypothetical protein